MSKRKSSSTTAIPFWKYVRVLFLLLILLFVALNAWRDKNQDWNKPIIILLHPINADGRPSTQQYIQKLNSDDFKSAQNYLRDNIQQFYGKASSLYIEYGREMTTPPPIVPNTQSIFDIALWSLKFRYYAWKHETSEDKHPTVTLYLNFYDPQFKKSLQHSTALQNGRIGIVNLFASNAQHGSNQVVLVHELLHAFGATDKYDINTGQPIHPFGLAEPNKQPLYPQSKAEIMGGYIALSPTQSKTPTSLEQTVINSLTAQEVGWQKP